MSAHLVLSISTLQDQVATSLQKPPSTITLHQDRPLQGIDHWIYYLKDQPEYILRVTKPRPGRPYNGQEMQHRDIALRQYIQSAYRARGLRGDLIPRSIDTWPALTGGEYCASLETRLYGSPLRAPISDTTADDLVLFLSIMKDVDINGISGKLGVKILDMFFPDLEVLRSSAIDAWRRMVERGQITAEDIGIVDQNGQGYDAARNFLAKQTACIQQIKNPSQTPSFSFVHDDLKSEHILIDESSGRITAILDCADAGRGNAAVHVSGLTLAVGMTTAALVARRAGYSEDTILQGIVQARCECTLRLDDRLNGRGGPAPVQMLRDHVFLSLEGE